MRQFNKLDELKWVRPGLFKLTRDAGDNKLLRKPVKIKNPTRCGGCGLHLVTGKTAYSSSISENKGFAYCSKNCPPEYETQIGANKIFIASLDRFRDLSNLPDSADVETSKERLKQMRALIILMKEFSTDLEFNYVTREYLSKSAEHLMLAIQAAQLPLEESISYGNVKAEKIHYLRMMNVLMKKFLGDSDIGMRPKREIHHALYLSIEAIRASMGTYVGNLRKRGQKIKGDSE